VEEWDYHYHFSKSCSSNDFDAEFVVWQSFIFEDLWFLLELPSDFFDHILRCVSNRFQGPAAEDENGACSNHSGHK
jgi:hypothetical protein